MITYGYWLYPELLPLIGTGSRAMLDTGDTIYEVGVNSTRLECFKSSPVCVGCGLVGEVWLLQSHGPLREAESRPHLNLFALNNDNLILMTQDHIYPKSKGGPSDASNLQTMCTNCNNKKGCLTPLELKESYINYSLFLKFVGNQKYAHLIASLALEGDEQ